MLSGLSSSGKCLARLLSHTWTAWPQRNIRSPDALQTLEAKSLVKISCFWQLPEGAAARKHEDAHNELDPEAWCWCGLELHALPWTEHLHVLDHQLRVVRLDRACQTHIAHTVFGKLEAASLLFCCLRDLWQLGLSIPNGWGGCLGTTFCQWHETAAQEAQAI
ncbi:unnamed protein product [Durusdinium trenchii]|uniref:Uncharacterized protein n=2 Tax=Durusdinium trenchii TaxID=1381693 RepID=A0ABP0KC69_9DINO